MSDLSKLVRIQIVIIVLFIFFKSIRPTVLDSNAPEWTKITLLSLPNFFEGAIGVIILTAIGLYLNYMVLPENRRIGRNLLYTLALSIASVYVITQELKIHNLGGRNVYDKNDLIFSVIGLVVGFLIVVLIKPKIHPEPT